MTKYLLTCGCGKTLPVEVGQAGEQRRLLVRRDSSTCRRCESCAICPWRRAARASHRQPGMRGKGSIAALLILAAVLALFALWSRLTEPTLPEFEPADYSHAIVDDGLKAMTPAQAWQLWIEHLQPLAERGFPKFEHPHTAAIEAAHRQRRFLQTTLLAIAGRVRRRRSRRRLLAAAARQGDRETRRQGDAYERRVSPCLPLSLSPCLLTSPRTDSARSSS